MLVEFSVGNYRSFRDRITFSMLATKLVAKHTSVDTNNTFTVSKDLTLLKSAVLYGANASGKSNFFYGISFMKSLVINSSKQTQVDEKIDVEPFRLNTETLEKPSFFEIVFFSKNIRYRYGFEITSREIVSEWLYYVPESRETMIFKRDQKGINMIKKYGGSGIQKMTRKNALFISVSAQFNIKIATDVVHWFSQNLQFIHGLQDEGHINFTFEYLKNPNSKREVLEFLSRLDLGFDEVEVQDLEVTKDLLPKNMPDELKKIVLDGNPKLTMVSTIHQTYNGKGEVVSEEKFNLATHESEGTQKVFALSGPIANTLKQGDTLFIDEFDARVHPLISHAIVKLFNSNELNPKNAQLIFITHDTNMLDSKLFRRDQIWFTEKDRFGATDLYSLAEYKIRNDASYESDYIKGRYGGVPFISKNSSWFE